MEAVIPFIVTALCAYGLFRRVNIFDSFVEGVKEGIGTLRFIAPTMIALLVAVGTLRASGLLDFIADLIRPLADTVGFPAELGEAIAKHLGSPKAMDRMISYLRYVKPKTEELVVDEMLAIRSEIDAWKEKKASEEANARYNEMLYYGFGDDDE